MAKNPRRSEEGLELDPNLLRQALSGGKKEAEELNVRLGFTKQTMKELQAMATLYTKSLTGSTETANRANFILGQQQALVTTLQKKMEGMNETSKEYLQLNNLTEQVLETSNDLASSKNQLMADLVLKQTMLNTGLIGEHAEQAKNFKLLLDQGAITKGIYDMHIKRLQQDQEHVRHLEEELELQEAIADSIKEIKEEAEGWKKSFTKIFETGKAIGRDPKLMGAFMMSEGIKGLEKFHHGYEELHHLGLSSGQAIQGMFKGMNVSTLLGLSDTKGVLEGVVEEYGNINALSEDTVVQLGTMAKKMGITGQEALKVNAALSQIPGETSESAANAMKLTGELAKANGIAPGKIMKDMAKNTELMALGGYKSAKAFGEAAIKAQKMGVELSTTKNVASGLLNFEDSINKQMEASVLLGREINLDKARELALQGKSVEATAEVLKNIGGQAEFEKMNVLQKQALAAATGMTVEELQKAADAQQEQNKYSGEGAGLINNALGSLMSYGGKAVGFFKENGMLLMSSIQFMQNFGLFQKLSNGLTAVGNALMNNRYLAATAHWVKEKAQWVAEKAHMAWKKGAAALGFGGGAATKVAGGAATKVAGGAAEKGLDVAAGAADKTKKLSESAGKVKPESGGGFVGFMKSLRDGLSEFGKKFGDVLKGALLLTLVGALMGTGLALIGLAVKAIGSSPQEMIMVGVALTLFATSLFIMSKSLGKISLGDVIKGGLALGILGAALIPAAIAFGMLKDVDTGKMIAFSITLPLLALAAAGLGFLIGPIALGAVALGLLGGALVVLAAGMAVASQGGFEIISQGMVMMGQAAPGLSTVALSMMGIAGGLGMMAISGMAAMPIIGMLIALAAVAPALVALGGALGGMFGGGGGDKEEKMDVLIGKIDQLIAVASKGGTINMDGKKVGEIVRLNINSSGVR
jgi:hypothetical protein